MLADLILLDSIFANNKYPHVLFFLKRTRSDAPSPDRMLYKMWDVVKPIITK